MRRAKVISGARVAKTLGVVLLATAVIPPVGAWWLNHRRVQGTYDRLIDAARYAPSVGAAAVVCGPGRLPDPEVPNRTVTHLAWISAASTPPEAFGSPVPTDAWGRCFLISAHWVLSAGPNGVIDTPLLAADLQGDDIGARR